MGEDGSAEERIKSLLGDSSDRGGLVRRRIVRRPLSGGYHAQPMVFSEVSPLATQAHAGFGRALHRAVSIDRCGELGWRGQRTRMCICSLSCKLPHSMHSTLKVKAVLACCAQREREAAGSPSLVGGDPLSEMLMHLAATRKGDSSYCHITPYPSHPVPPCLAPYCHVPSIRYTPSISTYPNLSHPILP